MPRVCPSPHPRTLDSALAGRGSSSPHPTVAPEPRGVASVAKGPQRDRSPHACGLRPSGQSSLTSLPLGDNHLSPHCFAPRWRLRSRRNVLDLFYCTSGLCGGRVPYAVVRTGTAIDVGHEAEPPPRMSSSSSSSEGSSRGRNLER